MSSNRESLADNFKYADFSGVTHEYDREDALSLEDLFSYENMWRGFSLSFGSDREAFGRTIEGLSIPELVTEGKLDIHRVAVSSDSSVSYLGVLKERIDPEKIVDALEIIQLADINVEKDFGLYPRLKTVSREGRIVSNIILESPGLEYDATDAPEDLSVSLSLFSRYLPELSNENEILPYRFMFAEEADRLAKRSDIVGRFITALAEEDGGLLMPTSVYELSIGPTHVQFDQIGVNIGTRVPNVSDRFKFYGGLAYPVAA